MRKSEEFQSCKPGTGGVTSLARTGLSNRGPEGVGRALWNSELVIRTIKKNRRPKRAKVERANDCRSKNRQKKKKKKKNTKRRRRKKGAKERLFSHRLFIFRGRGGLLAVWRCNGNLCQSGRSS